MSPWKHLHVHPFSQLLSVFLIGDFETFWGSLPARDWDSPWSHVIVDKEDVWSKPVFLVPSVIKSGWRYENQTAQCDSSQYFVFSPKGVVLSKADFGKVCLFLGKAGSSSEGVDLSLGQQTCSGPEAKLQVTAVSWEDVKNCCAALYHRHVCGFSRWNPHTQQKRTPSRQDLAAVNGFRLWLYPMPAQIG